MGSGGTPHSKGGPFLKVTTVTAELDSLWTMVLSAIVTKPSKSNTWREGIGGGFFVILLKEIETCI